MTDHFMPHGHCIRWDIPLLLTMVISNFTIAIAYFSIPISLVRVGLLKKARLVKNGFPLLILWATFIFLCGMTHGFDVVTMWVPLWWEDVGLRWVTAIVSATTALLWYRFISVEIKTNHAEEYSKLQAKIDEVKKLL